MKLGAFSVSLAVKDLTASRTFYEKLSFEKFAGDEAQNYLIMKNQDTLIGLFQGMFEQNILTFNPGWDQSASTLDDYDDVRDIQKQLKQQAVELQSEANESGSGPTSFTLLDPDGNVILVDQHI